VLDYLAVVKDTNRPLISLCQVNLSRLKFVFLLNVPQYHTEEKLSKHYATNRLLALSRSD
ncbi:hypothetical protein, partial [Escherichia coli]|uniref:hypothetical protein n=1 Tax=Escherichia coli TaxID=562 RepID=UPI003F46EA9C